MVKYKHSKEQYRLESARDDAEDYASSGGKKPKIAVVKLGKNSPAMKAHRAEKRKYSKHDLKVAHKHMKEHGG